MGVNFAMSGVYHQPFIIRVINQPFQNFFPHTPVTPATKAPMGVFPVAIIWRQIAPRRTSAQYPKNAIEKLAIIAGIAAPSSFSAWQ
jgi:hypothetical protein